MVPFSDLHYGRQDLAEVARLVDARPELLWSCLDALAARESQQIVDDALATPGDGTRIAEPTSMPRWTHRPVR